MSASFLFVLLDAAGKSAVLLAAAALYAALFRRASAAARHLAWSAAVAGALLLPLLCLVLPAWRAPWLPDWSVLPAAIISSPIESTSAPAPTVTITTATVDSHPAETHFLPVNSADLPASSATFADSLRRLLLRWSLPLWLAGSLFALTPLALGSWQMRRLTRRCAPVTDLAWTALLASLAASLQLRRRVRLLSGPGVNSPLTWGAWRPVLLLPVESAGWPPARRRLVLLHELAHIKRWDWLTQTLACLACTLYWFNPLAWLATRALRLERERACDDLVLRHGSRPSDYADELLQLATRLGSRGLINWAAVPMARRSTLEGRLLAILDPRRNRATLTRAAVLAALALVAVLLVPIAMLRAESEQTSPAAAASPRPSPASSQTLSDTSCLVARCWVMNVPSDFAFDPNAFDPKTLSQSEDIAISAVQTIPLLVGRFAELALTYQSPSDTPHSGIPVSCEFSVCMALINQNHYGKFNLTYGVSWPNSQKGIIRQVGNVTVNKPVLCDLDSHTAEQWDPKTRKLTTVELPIKARRNLVVFIFQPGEGGYPQLYPSPAASGKTTLPSAHPAITTASAPPQSPPSDSLPAVAAPATGLDIQPAAANGLDATRSNSNPTVTPSSVVLHGIIFSAPPDISVDPANTTMDLLLSKLSATPSVLITSVSNVTLPIGPTTKVKNRDGFKFPGSEKFVVVDFDFKVQVTLSDDHFHYQIESTHIQFPDAAPQLTANPVLVPPTTIVGNANWNQPILCDLGPSGGNPKTNYRELALLVFQPALPPSTSPAEPALESRAFPMPLAMVARLTGQHPVLTNGTIDPTSPAAQQITDDLKTFFVNAGVAFPTGANLTYDGANITVLNTPFSLDRVANLLSRYHSIDHAANQVEIWATFVDLPLQPDQSTAASPSTAGSNVGNATMPAAYNQPLLPSVNPPNSASPASFAAIGAFNRGQGNAVMHALEQMPDAVVLASPKVTVLSGKEAVISVAQAALKPPGGYYAIDPIGIEFKVQPTVEDDENISFSIKVRLSQLLSQNAAAGSIVRHTNVTELVTSGQVANGWTSVFDLGLTAGSPAHRRIAFVTFIIANPDGAAPAAGDQMIIPQPTHVAPGSSPPPSSSAAPAS